MSSVTKIFETYIKATPEKIWEAITDPDFNQRYGYLSPQHYDLKPGGKYEALSNADTRKMGLPDTIVDGEVVEVDPPHRLVQTYRFLFNPSHVDEGYTRVTWEITPSGPGFCRLQVTHDQLENAPQMAGAVSGKFSEQAVAAGVGSSTT